MKKNYGFTINVDKEAIDRIKDSLSKMTQQTTIHSQARDEAKLKWARYNAFLSVGFTKKQSLELCKTSKA